jgi:hypothetical protein
MMNAEVLIQEGQTLKPIAIVQDKKEQLLTRITCIGGKRNGNTG